MMTIHHTPDALPRPQMPKNWPFDKYVDFAYFPANDWAHKNHDRVLQIAERIVEQGIDLKIVLTGFQHRGEDWWRAEIDKRSLPDTLIHLGHIARPEVSWLYQNSIGLFFPSLFEGGGIPVIEAMSIGCPVACSALDALREVAGDSVLYFDPYDIDAMLSALMSLKTNESLRGALGAAGKAKSATFVYEKQIRDHRRVMEKARERYSPLKFWIRNKWLQPRSEKRFHKTVPQKQLAAAQALLTVNYSLCKNKPIEIIPGEIQPTSSGNINPRNFASVVRGLEYLPFDSLPQVEGREDLLKKQSGTGVAAAFYIVRYLQTSMHLEGDVCELGVASGASAALIANEIKASSKKMWLFDTFEGLPAPTTEDVLIDDIFGYGSIEKYKGQMAHEESEVLRKLTEIGFPKDRCHIVKGKVEETLKTPNLPDRISFAYIDLDFYSGVKHALDFLNERLVRGGSMIIDDYDFFSLGAKKAVDEFIARNASAYEFHLPQAQFGAFCILRKRN